MTDMNPDPQYGLPQPQPITPPQPLQQPQQVSQAQPLQQMQPLAQNQPQPQPVVGLDPQQPLYAAAPSVNNYITPPKPSKKWLIIAIVFITTTLIVIGLGIWLYMNYLDQKDNVDTKVSTAVAIAEKKLADKDAADFLEKEKQPNRQFAGPDDYGRVSFDYPKTWSIYVDKDASSGDTYAAYFNPVSVPPIDTNTQYALRVTIEQKDYDKVIATYDSLVKKGDLKATAVKADDADGTRFDGAFTKNIRGAAVVFKVRDKTVTIRSDADTFIRTKTTTTDGVTTDVASDFDAIIKSITFNK